VTTRIVLPMFKDRNKPFVLVFWSREELRFLGQLKRGKNMLARCAGL
jgi:hypothetical protein